MYSWVDGVVSHEGGTVCLGRNSYTEFLFPHNLLPPPPPLPLSVSTRNSESQVHLGVAHGAYMYSWVDGVASHEGGTCCLGRNSYTEFLFSHNLLPLPPLPLSVSTSNSESQVHLALHMEPTCTAGLMGWSVMRVAHSV